jgi:hypothetical protein
MTSRPLRDDAVVLLTGVGIGSVAARELDRWDDPLAHAICLVAAPQPGEW